MDPLPAGRPGGRLTVWLYGIAAASYAVDRITKVVVEAELAGRPPLRVIPGVLQLRFTENPGGAFSLFGSASWLFFTASVVVAAAIVMASLRVHHGVLAAGLGLVLGGAMGNLTDRILRGPGVSGEVVDFIDLMVWPVFNVADSAIVIGAGLILLGSVRRHE